MRGARAENRGQHEAALALFERALAAAPADPFVLMIYALNLNMGVPAESTKAIELIARAESLDPLNPLILYQHANLLHLLERIDEALGVAERLVAVAPASPLGFQKLGELKAEKGLFAEEFVAWRQSQSHDPSDHELASELALQLDKLGDRASADLWLAKAMSIAPGNFYPQAMEVQLAFRRGDLATTYAKALPLIPRHDDNRRGNWTLAVAEGCLAAVALGKEQEFRQAMIAARMLPAELTEPAFKALLSDRLNAGHLMAHIGDVAPCVFGTEPERAARLAAVDAIGTALMGANWAEGKRNPALLAFVRGDRAKLVSFLVDAIADGGEVARAEGFARWTGIAEEPALAKALADRRAQYDAEAARLPSLLAAAGVSAAP
jgi:tetratricopeptide (TPR) repeat protein